MSILPQQSSHDVPLSKTPRHEALHIGHVVDVARLVEAVADLRLIVFRELRERVDGLRSQRVAIGDPTKRRLERLQLLRQRREVVALFGGAEYERTPILEPVRGSALLEAPYEPDLF